MLQELYAALRRPAGAAATTATTTPTSARSSCPRSGPASSGPCWTRRGGRAALVYGQSAAWCPGTRTPSSAWTRPAATGGRPGPGPGGIRRRGEDGDAVPVAVHRVEAHGWCASTAPRRRAAATRRSWRFGLARLTRPVAPQLQQLALARRSLEMPAARAVPVPRRVLPAAAAGGHGDLLGRLVHAAARSPGRRWCCAPTTATPTSSTWAGSGPTRSGTRRCARRWRPATRSTGTGTWTPSGRCWPARPAAGPLRAAPAARRSPAPAGARARPRARAGRHRHHALHHRAAAAAGGPARADRRGHRGARRLPGGRGLAADRGVHRRGDRATPTGSTSA